MTGPARPEEAQMTRSAPAPSIPMASPAPMARFRMAPAGMATSCMATAEKIAAANLTTPGITAEAGR